MVAQGRGGLVMVLALSRGRRLHREQVVELLWPELDVANAAPRLHKAAHYARRAFDRPDAVVLREDMVLLLPGSPVDVDVPALEAAASAALADSSTAAAEAVLDRYPVEALSADLYADWAIETHERVEPS